MRPKKIAIITALAGQGHMSAALALDYWLTEWGYNTQVFNVGTSATDDVHKLLMLYPKAYKSFFRMSNNMRVPRMPVKSFTNLVENKMLDLLPRYLDFDGVISTYPMFHPQKAKKKIMLIPDPVVHASYLTQPYMDYYYSFWEDSNDFICNHKSVNFNCINPGPLARCKFYEKGSKINSPSDKVPFKKILGLDPSKTICLITAGGNWIYRSKKYLNLLERYFDSSSVQFVFVCGKNYEFYEEMQERYADSTLFKFLDWQNEDQISNWMSAADYVVGFSVAQMLVEAGLTRTPFILFEFIEGQEDGYVDVILNKNIGYYLEGSKKEKILQFKDLISTGVSELDADLDSWHTYLLNAPSETKKTFDYIFQ